MPKAFCDKLVAFDTALRHVGPMESDIRLPAAFVADKEAALPVSIAYGFLPGCLDALALPRGIAFALGFCWVGIVKP